MAETIEWAIFAYQGITLLQTAWINPFSLLYRAIILGLAAIHMLLAVIAFKNKGLIVTNKWWMVTWIIAAAAVPAAIAVMAPHNGYAANSSCVVACTYPAPVVLIISLYPWVFGALSLGMLVGAALIVVLITEWLTLVEILGDRFTLTAIQSILVSVLWVIAACGIGLALRGIVYVWLKDRGELGQQNTENFVTFLHSHIKAGLAAVEHDSPNVEAMLEKIHELHVVVSEKRLTLMLSKNQIPLAAVCSERIRVFTGLITFAETPRIGPRTVSQPVGRLIDRTLGDLLKNTVVHGAKTVWIRFSSAGSNFVLEILDDGPGFDDSTLDDPGKTLNHLRQAARDLGGNLARQSREPNGSHLVLTVPDIKDAAEWEDANARTADRRSRPTRRTHPSRTA
jgi:hypothetical protein